MTLNYLFHDSNNIQENILRLADNMAAAATGFNSHGYDVFISARDEFKEFINSNFQELDYEKDLESKDYLTLK